MDLLNYKYACQNVSLPVCSAIYGGSVGAKYPCKAIHIAGGVNIYSPCCIILLSIGIWMSLVLVKRACRSYSFPGRKEFTLFLGLYTVAQLLDLVLVSGAVRSSWKAPYNILVALQLAFLVTCSAALACSGLVWIFPSDMAYVCVWIARFVCLVTFGVSLGVIFAGLNPALGAVVFACTYFVPAFFGVVFAVTQLVKLAHINAEIWSYGTLFSVLLLSALAGMMPYIGGGFITAVTERGLDGVFMVHLCGLCAVIMAQKLWITDNEQEIESVKTLPIKRPV